MQSGRKAKTVAQKTLTNTVQPCRDAGKVQLTLATKKPIAAPDWLSDAAKTVWDTDLKRAQSLGLEELDTSMFAVYCESMAGFIAAVRVGALPNAASISELRKQMELLGMAGAKSRLAKIGQPEAPKASPFTVRKP